MSLRAKLSFNMCAQPSSIKHALLYAAAAHGLHGPAYKRAAFNGQKGLGAGICKWAHALTSTRTQQHGCGDHVSIVPHYVPHCPAPSETPCWDDVHDQLKSVGFATFSFKLPNLSSHRKTLWPTPPIWPMPFAHWQWMPSNKQTQDTLVPQWAWPIWQWHCGRAI